MAATAAASRVSRRRVQPDDNRPPTNSWPNPHREPIDKTLKSNAGAGGRDSRDSLADVTRRLKVIAAVATTAEIALRTQNCEQNVEIADCLRFGVVDALTTQIECISLLRSFASEDTSGVSRCV
jgi:hypothetical protein